MTEKFLEDEDDLENAATALLDAADPSEKDDSQETENSEGPAAALDSQFFANFLKDVVVLVKATVHGYFKDKKYHCGGPIPAQILDSEDYVTQVLNTTISDGVDRAYEAMRATGRYEHESKDGAVTDDIKTVISLLHKVERVIPQPFVAGILLMHLELVEGVEM